MTAIRVGDRSKYVHVWDGSHMLELCFDKALQLFPELLEAKETIGAVTTLFR